MTEQLFALQILNDDVTPLEAVIETLREFGLSKDDAINLTLAIHQNEGFFVEFGTYTEMSGREQQLNNIISARELLLKCAVRGPLEATVEDRWLQQLEAIKSPAVERLFWGGVFVTVAVVAIIAVLIVAGR